MSIKTDRLGGGGLNAQSAIMCGCLRDDVKGNLLVEYVTSLDLTSYNNKFIVDVTFTRLDPEAEILNWRT